MLRADGSRDVPRGTDGAELSPGDVFVIETPGDGGFGRAYPAEVAYVDTVAEED